MVRAEEPSSSSSVPVLRGARDLLNLSGSHVLCTPLQPFAQ
jgi:hypothetical protein